MLLYIMETHRKDGKPFSLKSIDGLVAGLNRYMKIQNKYAPNVSARKILALAFCVEPGILLLGNFGRKELVLSPRKLRFFLSRTNRSFGRGM